MTWIFSETDTRLRYFAARTVAMLALGVLLDRRALSFGGAMRACLALGVVGGVLYFLAPTAAKDGAGPTGVALVLTARVLLGFSSSVSVACLAFASAHVPRSRRTGLFAKMIGLQRASTPLAPLLVLGLTKIPRGATVLGLPVSTNDAAGLVVAAFNLAALALIAAKYVEPPRPPRHEAPRQSAAAVLATLRQTGAWASFLFSFQNNWNNQTLLWSLPLITAARYGPGAVRDALIFSTGGAVGACVASFIGSTRFRRLRIRDRDMIFVSQLGVGGVLMVYVVVFGCPNCVGGDKPLWLLWSIFALYYLPFIGQMPSNNSIYSKVIGSAAGDGDQGVYMSLLETTKSTARALAGAGIGAAYSSGVGPCALFVVTLGICALQFPAMAVVWERYDISKPRT